MEKTEIIEKNYLFLKTVNKSKANHVRIDTNGILFAKGCGDYTEVFVLRNKIQERYVINEKLHVITSTYNLRRVQRSYSVNISNINNITCKIINIGENKIPIGEHYHKEFMKEIYDYKMI